MAYGVIMCCHLHMPLYILGTFTEYPQLYLNFFSVFGRMRYAPTVNSFIFTNLTKLFYYGQQEEKHLGDYYPDADYYPYRYRDFIGSDFVLVGN